MKFRVTRRPVVLACLALCATGWTQLALGAGVASATPAAPTITSISPTTGPSTGGTAVIILGTGFTESTQVDFGTVSTFRVSFRSATKLRAVSPAQSAGTVDVHVINGRLSSASVTADQFTYTAAGVLAVTGLSPTSGDVIGGSVVTITGTDFTSSAKVDFGSTPATKVTYVSSTTLEATSPASSSTDTVDVRVIDSRKKESPVTPADEFTYFFVPPPTITALSPDTGTTLGGTRVYIAGTLFTKTSTVSFGGVPAQVSYQSPENLTAYSPAEAAGTVTVTVTDTVTGGGTVSSAPSSTADYTYVAPPTVAVTSISPSSGPTTGDTLVSIYGTVFSPTSTVKFGGVSIGRVYDLSKTEIQVFSPPGVGVVNVVVTTAGQSSPQTSADEFTYN
jgi:hypothetical protein